MYSQQICISNPSKLDEVCFGLLTLNKLGIEKESMFYHYATSSEFVMWIEIPHPVGCSITELYALRDEGVQVHSVD